jgi:uncharacterized protein YjbI with pentapeptide repeats
MFSEFEDVRFVGSKLLKVNFSHCNFMRVRFDYSDLCGAEFGQSMMSDTCFDDVDMRDSDLSLAQFDDCTFKNTRLDGCFVYGSDLTLSKNLSQLQVDSFFEGDSNTRLPQGLQRPTNWPLKRLDLYEISNSIQMRKKQKLKKTSDFSESAL